MPQRRKQQKGAGLFDILSSDPAKKIEANNKRIGELEKESEQKCDELKKKIDVQIADLKKKNEELQKAADAKKAADVQEAKSGSIFDGVKNLFAKPAVAEGAKPAVAEGAKPAAAEGAKPAAADKQAEADYASDEEVRPAANPVPPAVGNRMFGGKKSKRRRGSKARKSAKK
jgi:hypothetical protein